MKKTILILHFIFFLVVTYSQDFDLIITTEGDSIICKTDSITDSYYFIEMLVLDKWIPAQLGKITISDYQPKVINKEVVDVKLGKAKIKIYKAWIIPNNPTFEVRGILYEIKDSSISLSNSSVIEDYYVKKIETFNFQISDIRKIKIRRNNNIVKGLWIGALSGFTVGTIWGAIYGADEANSAAKNTFIAAFELSMLGAGIGALIGSFKIVIPINGDFTNYLLNKKKLKKYSLQFEN
ncbi:MAG: hypothetical protein QNK30_11315 [Bacteroidales bacterium]|nr:hypothetical protein [Bacteroidales bacterium]